MTLSVDNIVQVASGDTAGTPTTSVPFSLPQAPRSDTWTLVFAAIDRSVTVPTISGADTWYGLWQTNSAFNVTNAPMIHVQAAGVNSSISPTWPNGASSWTVDYVQAVPCAWMAVEIAGLLPFEGVLAQDGYVYDYNVNAGGAATSLNTSPQNRPAGRMDNIDFAAFVSRVASGAPPTVTGVANTTTQPGTWTQLLPSEVTSNAAAANVRLDVYYKVQGDQPGFYDATATYSGASYLSAVIGGLTAQPVVDPVGSITVC